MFQEVGNCNYRCSQSRIFDYIMRRSLGLLLLLVSTTKNKVSSKFHPAGHVMRCGSIPPVIFN